jgi:hypothetical protein
MVSLLQVNTGLQSPFQSLILQAKRTVYADQIGGADGNLAGNFVERYCLQWPFIAIIVDGLEQGLWLGEYGETAAGDVGLYRRGISFTITHQESTGDIELRVVISLP